MYVCVCNDGFMDAVCMCKQYILIFYVYLLVVLKNWLNTQVQLASKFSIGIVVRKIKIVKLT